MQGKVQVIVATIAFGMGVDKADIRYVIHCGMPGSLEGYYQEAGRAGRDGEKAYCVLLHAKKDVNTHKFFIRMSRTEMMDMGKGWEEVQKNMDVKYGKLDKIVEYATAKKCRRTMILEYFNDPDLKNHAKNCKGCDVCLGWKVSSEKQKKSKLEAKNGFLSATVKKTVELYEQKKTPQEISKKRGFGVRTIFGHLADWYEAGGKLDIDDFVSKSEQEKIARVISKLGKVEKLRPIKDVLPAEIGYEKIRFMIVKMRKEGLIK
jgi:superfamily II DNA helicase RecQ